MALKIETVHRHEILDRAIVAIECAKRDGGMIAVDVVAQRLLDEDAQCSMPEVELREEIARLAVARGVGVEFGSRPLACHRV